MGEVLLRNSFLDYNPEEKPYIVYELTEAVPDFSSFTYGSRHSVVLRNKETHQLEQLNFVICGDDGEFFPGVRSLWGDIESEDYHAVLVFNFDGDDVSKITASFCGNSLSRNEFAKIVEKAPYGAAATTYDIFFSSLDDSR